MYVVGNNWYTDRNALLPLEWDKKTNEYLEIQIALPTSFCRNMWSLMTKDKVLETSQEKDILSIHFASPDRSENLVVGYRKSAAPSNEIFVQLYKDEW